MATRVSVLVSPSAAGSNGLLISLDRQTLPASEFEVLVADDGSAPAVTARWDDLVAHRTNVRRVPVPAGTAAEGVVAALLEQADGEYVLAVPAGRRLTATALATLAGHADATTADVCDGLTGKAGQRPDRLPGPGGRLHRRTTLDPAALVADLRPAGSAPVASSTAVTDVLCFIDGRSPAARTVPPDTSAGTVTASTVTWHDGVLEIVADVAGSADGVRASIYSHPTGVEWPIPDVHVESGPEGARLTIRIDPADVPGTGRLPSGVWWPSVRIGEGAARLIEATPAVAHGATFGTRTVVSFADARRLGIDVGAGVRQPIRRLVPRATTVVEDSRGSLLTSQLTNVDLAPGGRIDGQLRLGQMPVVAWIAHRDGAPVLHAWVSGLAGDAVLHTRFSDAAFAPTGSRLVIDGVGAMTVARVEKRTKTDPTPPAPAPTGGPARRVVRRLARSIRR